MNLSLISPAIFAFLLSSIFCIVVLHLFPRINLLDNPKKYGYKRDPIPYPAGVAPIVAIGITILIFFPKSINFLGLIMALSLLTAVSFWDDRKDLSPQFRLLVHFGVAAIVAFSGVKIQYLGNPFGETLNLSETIPFLPEIITIIWLVGFLNVMNWLDGVPGLSAGSTAAAGIFLGLLSLSVDVSQPETAKFAFIIAGAALGFLLFNISPPMMLLGDTGAMGFGFLVASLSIFHGGKIATAFVVLAIPILDVMYVMLRRIMSGQNPLKGKDRRHLHERLQDLGLSDREILFFFLTVSIFLGWLSLQLQTMGKIILVLVLGVLFLVFSYFLEKKKK